MAVDSEGVTSEDDVIYLLGSANTERELSEEEEDVLERADDFLLIGTFRAERTLGETRLGKIYEGHSTEDGRAVLIYLMETEDATEADTSAGAAGAQTDTSPSRDDVASLGAPSRDDPSVEDGAPAGDASGDASGDESDVDGDPERVPEASGDDDLDVLDEDSPAATEEVSGEVHLEFWESLEHMHVAPLIAWGTEPVRHLVYLAEGTSLRRILESGYKLSLSQALLLGLQAAETLDGFANDGISHGDLRPENFLVDEQGRLRLAGLGAEEFRASLPSAAARRDDDYAAAEVMSAYSQSLAAPPDPSAADIYTLALTLAESILGRLISAKELQLLSSSGTSPSDEGTTTAKSLGSLAALFIQAVQSEPSERPNAGEFALALRATAESLPKPQRFDAALERVREIEGVRVDVAVSEQQGFLTRNLRLVASVSVAVLVVVCFLLLFVGVYRSERVSALAVPDVVGMDWAEADALLREQGWLTRRLEVRVTASRPEMVTGQLPSSGDLLEVGQVVKVQVSLGAPLVVVPLDLLGAPLEEARLRLSALGLRAGEIQRRPSPGTREGVVLEIDEQASEFPEGSQIDLVVSSAPAS